MKEMSTMEKVYFISAWVVAGCAFLALILYAVALRGKALMSFGSVLDGLFIGGTGCLALLYFSGWFKNSTVFYIVGFVVGGLALLAMIFTAAAGMGATYTIGSIFWHIGLGGFCTLLLFHLSGKFGKAG